MKRTIVLYTNSRPVHIHIFWTDKALQKIYPYILLTDILICFNINKLIAFIKKTDFILLDRGILDRGILDTVIDILWEIRNLNFFNNPVINRLISKYLMDVKIIILTVSIKEVVKRKNDILSLKEIKFKKKCFDIIARNMDILTIDTTNKSISDVFREITNFINSYIDYSKNKI